MSNRFARTEMITGRDALERLSCSRVAVFGLGGVGGAAAEALCRSGVGTLDIVDSDTIDETNLNRQIISLTSNVGMSKVKAWEARLKDINPDVIINCHEIFYLPENADTFDLSCYDYVVDAIDTVKAKLELIERCTALGVPVISAMGCGNRLDPTKLEIIDISRTSIDPLAKVMRKELRKRGINHLTVVWSKEAPAERVIAEGEGQPEQDPERGRKDTPGSSPFVPPSAGYAIASRVVRDLIGRE